MIDNVNTVDEDYYDAPESILAEEDLFEDVKMASAEEDFDVDQAVESLYAAIYGKD